MATSTPVIGTAAAATGGKRNCPDDYDRTDLHKVVLAADVSRVKSILETLRTRPVEEAQDVVNAKDCFGLTPLHLAVRGCPPSRTPLAKSAEGALRAKEKYREEEGVCADAQDPSGFTSSRLAVPRFLPEKESLAKEGFSNEEAGHGRMQADKDREEVVRLLVTSSWILPDKFLTATSEEDEEGQVCGRFTLLHHAARAGSIPILKILLEPPICRGDYKSCDPINLRATTCEGYTILDMAHYYGHEHVVELLENYDTSWLQEERMKLTSFLNAIMVGTTLILAAVFGAWRLPPMGVQEISVAEATDDARKNFVLQSKAAFMCYVDFICVFGFAIMALVTCISALKRREVTLRLDVENLRKKTSLAASELLLLALFMFANAYSIVSILTLSTIARSAWSTMKMHETYLLITIGSVYDVCDLCCFRVRYTIHVICTLNHESKI